MVQAGHNLDCQDNGKYCHRLQGPSEGLVHRAVSASYEVCLRTPPASSVPRDRSSGPKASIYPSRWKSNPRVERLTWRSLS